MSSGAADCAIATAVDLAADFLVLLRRREGERLPAWLDQAEASGLDDLERFAPTLRQDREAVQAGLTLHYSPLATACLTQPNCRKPIFETRESPDRHDPRSSG